VSGMGFVTPLKRNELSELVKSRSVMSMSMTDFCCTFVKIDIPMFNEFQGFVIGKGIIPI